MVILEHICFFKPGTEKSQQYRILGHICPLSIGTTMGYNLHSSEIYRELEEPISEVSALFYDSNQDLEYVPSDGSQEANKVMIIFFYSDIDNALLNYIESDQSLEASQLQMWLT